MNESERRFDDAWQEWPFEPLAVLEALAARQVEFVLIGGLAAVLHGSPLPTFDIDITVRRTGANIEALHLALVDMDALVVPDGDSEAETRDALQAGRLTSFCTRFGYVDVVGAPAALRDYRVLSRRAVWMQLRPGLRVKVAALQDIVASKQALSRTRDSAQIPALLALLEAVGRHPRAGGTTPRGEGDRARPVPGGRGALRNDGLGGHLHETWSGSACRSCS